MDYAVLSIIGLFAGLVGGLLGVGGSIVMIPAMTELLGERQHLYQAVAMIVNFCVVVPAALTHARAGAVMGSVVKRMIPLAVLGVLVGVWVSELPAFRGSGQAYLMVLFGSFLVYVAGYNVHRMLGRAGGQADKRTSEAATRGLGGCMKGLIRAAPVRKRSGFGGKNRSLTVAALFLEPLFKHPLRAALLAGAPTGFVAGLLGVGGGVVAVPLQHRVLGIPLRSAIGNSAAVIIALSFIGAIGKNYALAVHHPEYALSESLKLAAVLIPLAVVGSLIGSKLTHAIPLRVVRVLFILFLLVAAARMVTRGIASLSVSPTAQSCSVAPFGGLEKARRPTQGSPSDGPRPRFALGYIPSPLCGKRAARETTLCCRVSTTEQSRFAHRLPPRSGGGM